MNEKALYYPYINIPKSKWITQQLLYLDKLGSIVPSDYIYMPENLTGYMRDLVSAELVEQIFPAEYIPYNSNFEDAFIRLLKDKNIIGRKKLLGNNGFKIHIEKFGERLKRELEKMRLLRRIDYKWCYVEKTTAILLMTYIATFISSLPEISMKPITDNPEYLNPFTETSNRYGIELKTTILKELLPVPNSIVPVNKLVKFKEKYSDLLLSFRKEIDRKINNFSLIEDENTMDYEVKEFIDNSKEKINEISRRIEEQKLGKVNFGTITGVTASIIPAFDLTDITDIYKVIPGILGAAYSVISPRLKVRKELKYEPLAYASYVRKQII